jgi:hypothetical protein
MADDSSVAYAEFHREDGLTCGVGAFRNPNLSRLSRPEFWGTFVGDKEFPACTPGFLTAMLRTSGFSATFLIA